MQVRIGDRGQCETPMSPQGKVVIGGERYDARSDGRWIDAGRDVIVIRADHIGLIVQELEPGALPPRLANVGEPIPVPQWQRTSDEVERQQRREQQRAQRRQTIEHRYGRQIGASLGGLAGILVALLGVGADEVAAGQITYLQLLSALTLAGAILGLAAFWTIHSFLLEARRDYRNLGLVVLVMGLIGAGGGAAFGYSLWGLGGGIVWSILGLIALGGALPAFVVLMELIGEPEAPSE